MKIPWHLALCLTCTEQLPFVTMGHLPTEPSREKESKRSKLSVWSHQCTPTSQSAKHEENVRESMGITSVGCKVEAKTRVSGLWSSMDKTEGKINQEMTSCWLTTCCWQVIEESELLIRRFIFCQLQGADTSVITNSLINSRRSHFELVAWGFGRALTISGDPSSHVAKGMSPIASWWIVFNGGCAFCSRYILFGINVLPVWMGWMGMYFSWNLLLVVGVRRKHWQIAFLFNNNNNCFVLFCYQLSFRTCSTSVQHRSAD